MLKLKLQYLTTRWEELTHWKRPWCWERLKAGGDEDDRGWDGWMASLTQWTWVWVNSRSWWWTGRHGMLQSMGLQRVGHDWVTELNWTERAKQDSAPETPAEHVSVVRVANSYSMFTELRVDKRVIMVEQWKWWKKDESSNKQMSVLDSPSNWPDHLNLGFPYPTALHLDKWQIVKSIGMW